MDTERHYLIASQLELRPWTFTWSTARMICSAITTRCRLRGMPMGCGEIIGSSIEFCLKSLARLDFGQTAICDAHQCRSSQSAASSCLRHHAYLQEGSGQYEFAFKASQTWDHRHGAHFGCAHERNSVRDGCDSRLETRFMLHGVQQVVDRNAGYEDFDHNNHGENQHAPARANCL